jgi:hypothetical protein
MIDNFNSNVNPEKEEYKAITPFRMFIKGYFPFIEDTMEAFDNYGLLSKIVEYLNNVISNENTTIENINNLYNAFNSLKIELENYINIEVLPTLDNKIELVDEKIEYIDNYFDNLNVQNEINNKLDDLVADGTIASMIDPYFDSEVQPILNAYNTRLKVLEGRMDSFSHLTEGSTSGDAELIDIRNGAYGEKYPTAGDSVRGQIKEISEETRNILYGNIVQGYWSSNGTINNSASDSPYRLAFQELFTVNPETNYYFQFQNNIGGVQFRYFDSNKTSLSSTNWLSETNKKVQITTPQNTAFVGINIKKSDIATIQPSDVDIKFFQLETTEYTQLIPHVTATDYEVRNEIENIHNLFNEKSELFRACGDFICIGDSLTDGLYADITKGLIKQNYPYYLSRIFNCNVTNAGKNGGYPR